MMMHGPAHLKFNYLFSGWQ